MKSEHTIQLLLSGMLTWIGSKFQTFGMLILSLLFLMIIDYITGMLASRKEGIEHPDNISYGWNSRKGFLGILKKTGCWLVIGSAFSVDGYYTIPLPALGLSIPPISIWVFLLQYGTL